MNLMQRRRALMGIKGGGQTVHGTWEDLFRTIDAGTYATEYSIGEILPLDLGTAGAVNAQIIAFDADDKANGTGTAPVTLIGQYLTNSTKRWNPERTGSAGAYTIGTGPIGGWKMCELRSYLSGTILPLFPQNVRNRIVEVVKYSKSYNSDETEVTNDESADRLWIPSRKEVLNSTESKVYYTWFNSDARRQYAPANATSTYQPYWLRTAASTSRIEAILGTGKRGSSGNASQVATTVYILLGFCVG